MSTNAPTQQPSKPAKPQRQEMWWVILAKSKTLRFFAVSCEFILFLGGLWITFTVNDPSSKTWLSGNINMIFLTVMGWAIDAAMPEAWLHVVIQHVQKEKGQLGWSKFVAICISVLFIGNIVYSIFTSGDTSKSTGTPTDATAWILLFLTILRITVGFVYLTVRQCQEWIDRAKTSEVQTPPALPAVDVEELVSKAVEKLAGELASTQKQSLDLFRIEQQRLLGKVQDIENSVPSLDYEAIARAMMPQLRATFQSQARAITEEVQGRVKAIIEEGQGQSRPLSEPVSQRQLESRASSQSQQGRPPTLTLLPASNPEAEARARANGAPEERLQAAYEVLVGDNRRISGRALAKLAHVSRDTASKWLAEVKGQQEEPELEAIIETDCEIEAIAQGQ